MKSFEGVARVRFEALLFALLIASAMRTAMPRVVALAKDSVRLSSTDYERRREIILGDYYGAIRRIRATWERNVLYGIVLAAPRDIDRAVFVNYYLYPRPSHIFWPGQHPNACPRPVRSVWVNVDRSPAVQETPFDLEMMRMPDAPLPSSPFIVPLAISTSGANAEDYYVLQANLSVERDTWIEMTFEPLHLTRTVRIAAGANLALSDVAFQVFQRTGTGWLRVHANGPIRGFFAIANATKRRSSVLRILTSVTSVRRRIEGCGKLWLLNASDSAVNVDVNGRGVQLRPRELRPMELKGSASISGDPPVFAFASQKTADGGTVFLWAHEDS